MLRGNAHLLYTLLPKNLQGNHMLACENADCLMVSTVKGRLTTLLWSAEFLKNGSLDPLLIIDDFTPPFQNHDVLEHTEAIVSKFLMRTDPSKSTTFLQFDTGDIGREGF